MGKIVDNLDDVAKLLSKKSEQKIILKKRNQSQRILRNKRNKREHNEDRKIMLIPVLIIVLIFLIKFLEALGLGVPLTPKNKIIASASEMQSPSNLEEEKKDDSLKEYNDDVLEKFFREYFQAKLTADVDTLYRLSGVTNQSTEQTNKLKAQLKTQSGYIEAYEDIKTYAVPGIGENEKLVFLQYKVRFRRAKTAAPAIMYCYIKINAVDSQLLEALSSDSRLAVLYDAFQTGRIYKEDQASIDSEVSLIEMDENGPTVSESESSSESDGTSSPSTESEGSEQNAASESSETAVIETSAGTAATETSGGA